MAKSRHRHRHRRRRKTGGIDRRPLDVEAQDDAYKKQLRIAMGKSAGGGRRRKTHRRRHKKHRTRRYR